MTKKKAVVQDEDMATASILEYFASVPDPRLERSRLHPLASVLVLSLCAVVCGADSFVAIEYFGTARKAWLETFLDLPNGIPSHDTIGRIFGMLNPKALEEAFRRWSAALADLTEGEVVAIDGKTLRRSFQKAGSGAFVHMVSAWATGNRMVLGQVKTEEKSNEITAIPRLLELLQLKGCLVTIVTSPPAGARLAANFSAPPARLRWLPLASGCCRWPRVFRWWRVGCWSRVARLRLPER
jgi:hypothetical protein